MYVIGDKQMSDKEAEDFATDFGSDVKTLAELNGWEYVEETDPPKKGKLIGPTVETQLPGPVTEATAGVSSSVDTSLESPEFPNMLGEVEVVADKVSLSELSAKLEAIDEDSEIYEAYNNIFNFERNYYDGLYYPAYAESVKKERAKTRQEKEDNRKWWQKGLLYRNLEPRDLSPTPDVKDILASLGPEAGEEYLRLVRAANVTSALDAFGRRRTSGTAGLTEEQIKEFGFVDYLKKIPGADVAINQAISKKRNEQTDLFFADKTQEERDAYLLFIPGSPEYNEKIKKAAEFNNMMFGENSDIANENLPKQAKSFASELRKTFEKSYSALEAEHKYLETEQVKLNAGNKKLEDLIKTHESAFAEMEAALPDEPVYTRIRPFQILGEQDLEMERAFRDRYVNSAGEYNKDIEKMSAYRDKAVEEIEVLQNNIVKGLRDFNQRIDIYTKAHDKLTKDQETLSITEAVVGSVTKNWSMLDRTLLSLEDFFIGSIVGLDILGTEIVQELTDENSEIHKTAKKLQGGWMNYLSYIEGKREELPYLGSLDKGDIENFGLYTLGKFSEGVPSLLSVLGPQGLATYFGRKTAMKVAINLGKKKASRQTTAAFVAKSQKSMSAYFTMPVFGIVGGGSRANTITNLQSSADEIKKQLNEDLKNASTQFQKDKINKELEYINNVANMPLYVKAGQVLMSGLIEPFSERAGSIRWARNLQRYSRPVAYNQIKGLIKNAKASKFLAGTFGTLKATGLASSIEIGEEITAEGLNDGIDIYNGKPISIFENVNKDFTYGTFINVLGMQGGGSFSGLTGLYKTAMYNRSQIKEHKALANDFFTLQAEVDGLKELEQTPEVIEQLKTKELTKVAILNSILKTQVSASINIASLNEQDFKELIRLEGEQRYLANQAGALGLSGELKGRKDIDNLKESFVDLEEQRQAILSKKENQTKEEAEALAKEAKLEGARKAEMLTFLSSYEYHKGISMASSADNMSVVNNNEDIDNLDISDELKQSLKDKALFNSEEKVGDNGYYDIKSGKYYIFENNVKVNISTGGLNAAIAAASPSHEQGHAQIRAYGIIKDGETVGIADGLVQELLNVVSNLSLSGKVSEKEIGQLADRIDSYKKQNDGKHDVDELIQLMVELKAGGYIKGADLRQMWQVKALVNSLYNKIYKNQAPYFQLETQEDVLGFIETWQNSTKAMMPPGEEDISSKASKPLLDEINALLPESVQTREQFFDRKVFNPIYNDGKLHPAIANYIRSRAVSKEEAQKIIESVGDRLVNFNPEAKRKSGDAKITLGEFIFSNVNFGKLDARKALFEEGQERAQTESTDSETAKQVVAAEDAVAPVAEKKTYKTLSQARVLSFENVEKIKVKLKSAVRTMKTRMGQTVSKNVTVKPYIAEIKKVMGKQADILFKKEIGGLKDAQMRKYLIKHKKAILENMTTTYLMTAMPNAVQKQVDGAFTSNWQGKKIDRESVSTAQAGRTSGAEIVRRLPNASARLSDADYLSNFFNTDGSLIRGRKESLAKALSEEFAFDVFNEELQNPNSEIRQAYETRQEELGEELFDNYIVNAQRDLERGSAKASTGFNVLNPKHIKRAKALYKEIKINGVDEVMDLDGNLLFSYAEDYKDLNGIGKWMSTAVKAGVLIGDIKSFGFQQRTQKSKYVPESVKKATKLGLASDRLNSRRKQKMADGMLLLAQEIGGKLVNALNIELFGSHYRYLDTAKTKKDTEKPGEFFEWSKKVKGVSSDKSLVSDETIENIELMNSSMGLMRQIWTNILSKKMTVSEKLFKLKDYEERIKKANIANKEAYEAVMLAIYDLYKSGKIDGEVMQQFFQMQTSLKAGLRALSSLSYITITEEAMVHPKGEHLADNASTSFDIMEKIFEGVTRDEFKSFVSDKLQFHDQWLEEVAVTKVVDIFGANNQTLDLRMFGSNRMGDIYAIDGRTAKELIQERKASIDKALAFNENINWENLETAKQEINNLENKAPSKASQGLSKEFNNILERKTGVESFKTFSAVQAQKRGEKKGKFKFFVAPSVDDFRGLVNYAFAGKGKQGEADMKWLEDNLMTPYAKGVAAINGIRQQIKRDFKTAVKAFPKQYQLLNKEIGKTGFNYDQAVRVYLWGKAGIKVPGLSQKDTKILQDAIRENPELMDFADAMLVVARRDTWMEPSEYWSASTLLSDLNSMTEKIGRKKYLEEFIANADAIFTTENLNKIEALYGKAHRDAIEDSLYSMKNGTNRSAGGNKQVNAWLNWINGSTGAIMFFNRRSALLQMLSTVNFINYSDNNPLKAAAAFANQPQYWKDWAMIFNSDKLKERRGGLKQDVSSNEIASIANANKNSPQAILARLLQLGFTPTQIADSMAIASGGATFYRNRVNTYIKGGMSKTEAEAQAFLDFSKISDETQQSSDPALVSQVQRSNLGRLVFAFQNTPMQMTRLMKKDALDIINGRGDWRAKVARITYYGAIQNFIFASLQSALFALLPGFDDDDEDLTAAELEKKNAKEEAKIARVLNSMLDTLLRGSGVYGAVFSTVKNIIREYNKQEKKGFMSNHAYTVLSLFDISPPIGSKARKVHSAIQTRKFEKDEIEARGWGVVADGRLDLGPNWSILGKVLSAAASVPLDRVVDELTSVSEAFDARNKAWQRIALGLGWKTWDVGAIEENAEAIKEAAKKERKEAGTKKAKETRANKKVAKEFKDVSDF